MSHLDTLCIELTTRCPLSCIHCSANAGPERTDRLDPALLVMRLREQGRLREVYFSGGEPFEYPDLEQVCREASALADRVAIYSSGARLSVDGIAPLTEVQVSQVARWVDRVDISLYAITATDHDAITQVRGSFDCTLRSLRRLRQLGVSFGIHYVPLRATTDVLRLAAFARELGAMRFHVLALATQGRAQGFSATYDEALGNRLRRLVQIDLGLEVILSSKLRQQMGLGSSPRDARSAGFLDVHGRMYPGEGNRSRAKRSLRTLSNSSLRELLSEVAS